MTQKTEPSPSTTAAEMRAAFDASFAEPRETRSPEFTHFLCVRAGERSFALNRDEIAAVWKCPELTELPSANRALAGLAGVRGAIVGVYDLEALVMGADAGTTDSGWAAQCAGDPSAALRFDELIGYERVAPEQMQPRHAETNDVLVVDDEMYSIVDVTRLLGANETDVREE